MGAAWSNTKGPSKWFIIFSVLFCFAGGLCSGFTQLDSDEKPNPLALAIAGAILTGIGIVFFALASIDWV